MSTGGTFALSSSDNVEAFLGALGVSSEKIAVYAAAKPTVELSFDGTTLKLNSNFNGKTVENVLTVGKPSPFKLGSGAEFQVELQAPSNGKTTGTFDVKGKTGNIDIEFGSGQLVETFTYNGVTAKRVYKKQ